MSSMDLIPYVIISGRTDGRYMDILISYTLLYQRSIEYITSHYIIIDLGSLPLYPRAFMWIWERLNRTEPTIVGYSNDVDVPHYLSIPRDDEIYQTWINDVFTTMTSPLTDPQLRTLREMRTSKASWWISEHIRYHISQSLTIGGKEANSTSITGSIYYENKWDPRSESTTET